MRQATRVRGDHWLGWQAAMQEALYGPPGFYRRPGAPARHFRTSVHASRHFAAAVARLASAMQAPAVLDVGAGGGELLRALQPLLPGTTLTGVERAGRPDGLPTTVAWEQELPMAYDGLVIANEWLDNVPVDVVELTADGPRLVEVSPSGVERLGGAPSGAQQAWLDRWWPLAEVGDRAEVGDTRDQAWADVVRRLGRGAAVAVDYAVDPPAAAAGTLTGYRDGRQVLPVPDGTCDITAHVLMQSCGQAGERAGAEWTVLMSQRDALHRLEVSGRRPAYELARTDPAGYLRELASASEAAELTGPGLGDFRWLLQGRGVPPPGPIVGASTA